MINVEFRDNTGERISITYDITPGEPVELPNYDVYDIVIWLGTKPMTGFTMDNEGVITMDDPIPKVE